MTRIRTATPATQRPVRVALAGIPEIWTTIAEAPDFSVPDPNAEWSDRSDPENDKRRIQSGQVIIMPVLKFVNSDPNQSHMVAVRILLETGDEIPLGEVSVTKGDGFEFPMTGIRLIKDHPNTAHGDRLQVKASTQNVLSVCGGALEGGASEHLPVRG